MPKLRPEEEWARQMMEAALGVPVVQYDDQSRDGMHDLEVRPPGEPAQAVEVTAAADPESIELWNLVNGGDGMRTEPTLTGGWMVVLTPAAQVRDLNRSLVPLLERLERAGVREVASRSPTHRQMLERLGIVRARQGDTSRPGSVYFTIRQPAEHTGAFVPDHSNAVPAWITDYTATDLVANKRVKLAASGCERRHLFLLLPGFTSAPFLVTYALTADAPPLPTDAPALSPEITDVWLASTWRQGVGLRWSRLDGWQHFDKLQPA